MRIGIFTELYPPHIGGQEIRYAELAEAMLRLGHAVDVYCIRHARDAAEAETVAGVSIQRFPLAEHYQKPLWKPLKRALIPLLRYAWWTRRMARPGRYDLMLFNQWPLAHIVFARKESRGKIVLDWCEVRNQRVYAWFMQHLPKLAARNIAVSRAVAAAVEEKSGCPVEYIPSGIWPERYRPAGREMRSGLLYVGRVAEHKNLGLLLATFKVLKARGFPGGLTIAGSGPALQDLTALCQASPLAKEIQLLGYVEDAAKIDLLTQAEVMVIPSKREGFPRVVAEAMASGLPVVTADYQDNGTKNVVREYGIGLVGAAASEAMAAAIQAVREDWERYSQSGLRHVAELDWKLLVSRLLAGTGTELGPETRG